MARLLFRDSQGREGAVELSQTEIVYVGRGLECAIRTDDGLVSRRHSQIRMEGGRFVVEDLGSSNGVYLNNARVQKQALGHADMIQCGSLMIRFIDESQVTVPPGYDGSSPPGFGGDRASLPYGGPPAMPVSVSVVDLGMPGEGDAADVAVDAQHADGEIQALRADLEKATAAYEREVADGKRVRAEVRALRDCIDDLNRQVMALSQTKDEGWNKLNEQLAEIEHLRKVINAQEVELQETQHAKWAAESARNVAQDALVKAEVSRHRATGETSWAPDAAPDAGRDEDPTHADLDDGDSKLEP
ncbi:MAG: Forkhead-associated protein [Deltaproteobacteria bacterium]|nr:Forkhead-associated protein [Deltaproteobacteria bacterium]